MDNLSPSTDILDESHDLPEVDDPTEEYVGPLPREIDRSPIAEAWFDHIDRRPRAPRVLHIGGFEVNLDDDTMVDTACGVPFYDGDVTLETIIWLA